MVMVSLNLPRIKKPIPLFVLFRALGISTDKQICQKILLNMDDKKNKKMLKFLKESISSTSDYNDYESCLKYVTSSVIFTPINMTKEEGDIKKRIRTRCIEK